MSKAQAGAVVEHLSVAERSARGRTARGEVPRSEHAAWDAPSKRRDPVELLEEQAATRVPELVPVRYGRMLVSPFTFYRGAAYLMASDLSNMPRTGLHVRLCGDAHLSNFGAFAAPDRRLVFSINDFDETHPGPFEWDVKRLVASFAVAGRDRGFDDKQRETVNLAVGRSYREAISRYAGMKNLDLWYSRIDVDDLLFLQFKEAEASVLEPFLTKSEFANHGQRVVEGQRLTQAASDIMLGYIRAEGVDGNKRDYYVRQLWDAKGSALVELMEPTIMSLYARACGAELARAHARSGDAIAIASYLGASDTFDRAVAGFAESYADQNER